MQVLILVCCLAATSWAQTTPGSASTVFDYISRRYSSFASLITQAGLDTTLKGAGPFTVFVPSYSSLSQIPGLTNDTDRAKALVQFHVATGTYKSSDFWNERLVDTLQAGAQIRINHYMATGRYTAEGVRISYGNHVESNGIIHLLSGVMTPPVGTVIDVVQADQNLTTLMGAIQQAGLGNFFQDQNPITLFAPTDAAFAKLGKSVVQGLLTNPTLLKTVLNYHVIPGSLYKQGYHPSTLHTFDEADRLTLQRYFFLDYEVDRTSFSGPELSATNGVVHKVNSVLIPSSVASQIKALAGTTPGMSTAFTTAPTPPGVSVP